MEAVAGYDSFDVAEWVEQHERETGVRVDWARVAECRTLADSIRYLSSLGDRE